MEISERKKYVRIGHSVPLRDKIIYFSASFETPFLADGVSSRFFLFSVSGASECQKYWWVQDYKLAHLQIFKFFIKFLHCLEVDTYRNF